MQEMHSCQSPVAGTEVGRLVVGRLVRSLLRWVACVVGSLTGGCLVDWVRVGRTLVGGDGRRQRDEGQARETRVVGGKGPEGDEPELTYGLCYSSGGSSSNSSSGGQGNAAREAVKMARWARCTAIPIRTRPRNGVFFMAKGRDSGCRSRCRFRSFLPWQRWDGGAASEVGGRDGCCAVRKQMLADGCWLLVVAKR